MKKREFFKIDGDKINRIRKHCPKCGPGVFIAEHKNRISCGKCGYTEFKGGGKPQKTNKTDEKPIEKSDKTPHEQLKDDSSKEPKIANISNSQTESSQSVPFKESTSEKSHISESSKVESNIKEDTQNSSEEDSNLDKKDGSSNKTKQV
jgi:small subunit ribosomal protein S27Ae